MSRRIFTKRKRVKSATMALAVVAAIIVWLMSGNPFDGLENTLGKKDLTDEDFAVYFLDVGQGDCTFIICDGCTCLIDAGDNGYEQTVMKFLDSEGVEKLDYAVATHPHADHIGGMAEIAENYDIGTFIMPSVSEDSISGVYTYENMIESLDKSGVEITDADVGMTFSVGSADVEIIAPLSDDTDDLNNMSAVMKLTYGESTFLLTADAGSEEESEILESGANVDCDLLKVAHHGSSDSSTEEFLEAATPDYCVISCGKDNDYGHPHAETLQRLEEYTDEIYRTDRCGTIKAVSDGKNITVTYAD